MLFVVGWATIYIAAVVVADLNEDNGMIILKHKYIMDVNASNQCSPSPAPHMGSGRLPKDSPFE